MIFIFNIITALNYNQDRGIFCPCGKDALSLAMIYICSSTSGLKLTDCTNVVASKYFSWQDLCQAVGG